jgi:hypothetical protein
MPPASTSGIGQLATSLKGCDFFRCQLTMIRHALTIVEALAAGVPRNAHRSTGSIPNDLRGVTGCRECHRHTMSSNIDHEGGLTNKPWDVVGIAQGETGSTVGCSLRYGATAPWRELGELEGSRQVTGDYRGVGHAGQGAQAHWLPSGASSSCSATAKH